MKLSTASLFGGVAIAAHAHSSSPSEQPQLQYANHIFNAVHSSMRQFGSSLNHNGMSLFIASVPEGTEFYHGTNSAYRVNGTEWLAFEPEHALIFARGGHGPGRGRSGEPGGPPPPPPPPPGRRGQERPSSTRQDPVSTDDRRPPQGPDAAPPQQGGPGPVPWGLNGPPLPPNGDQSQAPPPEDDQVAKGDLRRHAPSSAFAKTAQQKPVMNDAEVQHGYLHTYRARHALRLLYLDGQSAAKSEKGTLDTQDLVLLHHNLPTPQHGGPPPPPARIWHDGKDGYGGPPPPPGPRSERTPGDDKDEKRPHGPMGEAERAVDMCHLAQTEWDGQVDGILRMEGGFEIILCSFEKDLDIVRITQSKPQQDGGMGPPGQRDSGESFNYYGAVAARYDGIGGGRADVDYEDFVTLFSFPDVVYFDKTGRPRVDNSSTVGITSARSAIKDMVLREHGKRPTDWQAIADLIITRYADRLEYLSTSSAFRTLETFTAEVDRALRPFIDYGARNISREVLRCASQFLPFNHSQTSTAYDAISNVTTVLCKTLSAASRADTLSHGLSLIRGLKSWLAWTTWKKCRGCAAHEICFLPIWPVGSEADFDKPRCVSQIEDNRGEYWGGMGGPPHGGPPSDGKDGEEEWRKNERGIGE